MSEDIPRGENRARLRALRTVDENLFINRLTGWFMILWADRGGDNGSRR